MNEDPNEALKSLFEDDGIQDAAETLRSLSQGFEVSHAGQSESEERFKRLVDNYLSKLQHYRTPYEPPTTDTRIYDNTIETLRCDQRNDLKDLCNQIKNEYALNDATNCITWLKLLPSALKDSEDYHKHLAKIIYEQYQSHSLSQPQINPPRPMQTLLNILYMPVAPDLPEQTLNIENYQNPDDTSEELYPDRASDEE